MLRRLRKKHSVCKRRLRRKEGQAITEYGAILAFVAVLVALAFASTTSGFAGAVSAAFSSITNQLNDMVNAAAASS
jgi:Flp pilus assembly pilin Flp